ncbi:hypothetical protein I3842_13G039400 [Carya illinoinensis]|uniref:Uncharacterized protein n=1 Tax=Carya illinoinensis TaxID=32201 RepID=A0A922AJX0_CARIL|nr:hypothetical protein I3842_13G039400 [Carya illinoinensis]
MALGQDGTSGSSTVLQLSDSLFWSMALPKVSSIALGELVKGCVNPYLSKFFSPYNLHACTHPPLRRCSPELTSFTLPLLLLFLLFPSVKYPLQLVSMDEVRRFMVESKSFFFSKVGANSFRITEKNRRMVLFILINGATASWVVRMVMEAIDAPLREGFFKKLRMGNGLFTLQLLRNSRGRYLLLEDFINGRRRGSLIIPEGVKGSGWEGFSYHLRKVAEQVVAHSEIEKRDGTVVEAGTTSYAAALVGSLPEHLLPSGSNIPDSCPVVFGGSSDDYKNMGDVEGVLWAVRAQLSRVLQEVSSLMKRVDLGLNMVMGLDNVGGGRKQSTLSFSRVADQSTLRGEEGGLIGTKGFNGLGPSIRPLHDQVGGRNVVEPRAGPNAQPGTQAPVSQAPGPPSRASGPLTGHGPQALQTDLPAPQNALSTPRPPATTCHKEVSAEKNHPSSSQATNGSPSTQNRPINSGEPGECFLKTKEPTDCSSKGTGAPCTLGSTVGAVSVDPILSLGLSESLSRVLCTVVEEVDASPTEGGSSEEGSIYGSDLQLFCKEVGTEILSAYPSEPEDLLSPLCSLPPADTGTDLHPEWVLQKVNEMRHCLGMSCEGFGTKCKLSS